MADARRILLLIPSLRNAGGTERVVCNLAELLIGLGYNVELACFDEPGSPRHFASGLPCHQLGRSLAKPSFLRPLEYLTQARSLRALKRRFRPDLVISNLWRADLISQLSGGPDGKIAIAHINVIGNKTNRAMLRLLPLVAAVYRQFQRVVAVSPVLAQELGALYRLDPDQIVAIDNFSDRPEAQPCLPGDGIRRLVWCGRLVPEKNLAGFLEVWARFCLDHKAVQLVVLGDGLLRPDLEAQAGQLDLRIGISPDDQGAEIVFAGMVPNAANYMASARALVLSSEAEGMPMVLLEAISLGTPILASDCPAGGVKAVLSDDGAEETGFGALLPIPRIGDPASQAPWLPWLARSVDSDSAVSTWRQNARARAKRYSSKTAATSWQKLLEGVLG